MTVKKIKFYLHDGSAVESLDGIPERNVRAVEVTETLTATELRARGYCLVKSDFDSKPIGGFH